MLTLDLVRLERERGPVRIQERVPGDAALFDDADVDLASPLEVDLTVTRLAGGEVVVRGTFSGTLARECRRCLDAMEVPLEGEVDLLWVPGGASGNEARDDEPRARTFDVTARTLELGAAVREEVILEAPLYVECDPDCKGLCPVCGADRNEEDCDCTRREPDPRWDALRALNAE